MKSRKHLSVIHSWQLPVEENMVLLLSCVAYLEVSGKRHIRIKCPRPVGGR